MITIATDTLHLRIPQRVTENKHELKKKKGGVKEKISSSFPSHSD